MRSFRILLLLVSLAALIFFGLRPRGTSPVSNPRDGSRERSDAERATPGNGGKKERAGRAEAAALKTAPKEIQLIDLTAELNAPGKTAVDDLRILEGVFLAWQSNFLNQGNPVGTNAEITRALLGDNELGLAYVAPSNRALNNERELCDRWGTPYFFHQFSGSQMQIISAGPDKKRGTEDDLGL